MANPATATRFDTRLRYGAHVWLFTLVFSTFLAEALALGLILAWLWSRRFLRTPLDFFILLFLGLRLLAIATAISPATSMHALRKIPFILIYFPLAHVARHYGSNEIYKLLRTMVCASLMASFIGLVRVLLTPVWRLASTTSGATTLAMFLAVSFVVALTLVLRNELQPARAWLLGNMMLLLALAYTRCRAPWMATLLVSAFIARPLRRGLLVLAITALGMLLLVPGFGMRHAEILRWPPHLGDRPVIWKAGWELVQQRPLLGYGPESFALLFHSRHELKDKRIDAWHNFALQLLIESGMTGLTGFLALIAQAFLALHKGRSASALAGNAATALCAGLSTLLLAGLFGGLIGDPLLDMLLWGLLGMISGMAAQARK